MSQLNDRVNASSHVAPADPAERRRPGRPETVSPALLPLLRRHSLMQDALGHREPDDLAAARGIGLGVVIGLAIWLALAVLAWWIFAG